MALEKGIELVGTLALRIYLRRCFIMFLLNKISTFTLKIRSSHLFLLSIISLVCK
jgi:hypothetical protein